MLPQKGQNSTFLSLNKNFCGFSIFVRFRPCLSILFQYILDEQAAQHHMSFTDDL